MTVVETLFGAASEFVNVCIDKGFGFCYGKHRRTVGCREELSVAVEELQGIPMAWIVGGRDDYAAVSA